jgi:hypothetical protein
MPRYALVWSPEGRVIAHVDAPNERAALRQAPHPYRKYLGEIYVIASPDPDESIQDGPR